MAGIGSWVTKRSHIDGNKVAIVYQERRLTYRELNRRVNRLANGMAKLGVRNGDRVASLLMNGNEFLEVFFACAKLGAVFVPINFRLVSDEVEYILNDTGARALIYHAELVNLAAEVIRRVTMIHGIQAGGQPLDGVIGYEALMDANSYDEPGSDVDWEDLFLVMYTSGTSAKPKGAMLTHASFQWSLLDLLNCAPLRNSDISLAVAPLFHAGAMMTYTMPLLYQGGTVIIEDQFDPVRTLDLIEKWEISCLFLVPAMWLAVKNVPNIDKYDISSLLFCVTGGAACPLEIIEFYQNKGINLVEGYGMTEAGGIYTMLDEDSCLRKSGSIGKPFMHVEVRIVDENDWDVPQGTAGELLVRSPNVMKGYWNKPEETREVLKGGWLYTGDMCRIDEEGYIYFVDKKKDMIISGGENISSAEIEHVLRKHPGITDVAVISVPDEKWGETVLAVVVQKEPGQSMKIEELREFCDGKLARYKMPRLLKIAPSLPRDAAGQVLKAALKN